MVFGTNETLHDENKQTNTKEIINIFFIKNSLKHSIMQKVPGRTDGNWRKGLRSLWHLSRHLTARADDNHAAPSFVSLASRTTFIILH